jgi:hypothetical protein
MRQSVEVNGSSEYAPVESSTRVPGCFGIGADLTGWQPRNDSAHGGSRKIVLVLFT